MRFSSFVLSASRRSRSVEKLDQAISVIESLNGSGTVRASKPTDPNNIAGFTAQDGAGTTGTMGEGSERIAARSRLAKTTASAPVKHTMSAAARRKIAAFQRARWAKIKAQQKKAA